MVGDVGLAVLGVAMGLVGTLIGAGGGFVLVPTLLILYPGERPDVVTSISLAVVFFNALSGSIAYGRMKRIDYKSGALFAAATIPGAIVGALTTAYVPRRTFDFALGALIFGVAVFLVYRPGGETHNARNVSASPKGLRRVVVDREGKRYEYRYSPGLGIGISAGAGYLSSLLGIGGGIIHVPALTRLLHFPVHVATATSHFVLAWMAAAGTVTHLVSGQFHRGFHRAGALAVGVVIGAQAGAALSNRMQAAWILRILAAGLGLVGLRLLYMAVQ